MMMKIKHFVPQHQQQSPNTSNSSLSRDDQELGSIAMSVNGGSLVKTRLLRCFQYEMDLNPVRMILAEMVGTFILVFCVCGIIASTQLLGGEVGLLEYSATAGLTVVVVVFSIGPISGAHVNPAVTIAFAIVGHFPWSRVPFYVLAQTIGSVLATCVGGAVYGVKPDLMATRPIQGCIAAFWVEFFATFIVVLLAAAMICEAQSVRRKYLSHVNKNSILESKTRLKVSTFEKFVLKTLYKCVLTRPVVSRPLGLTIFILNYGSLFGTTTKVFGPPREGLSESSRL